MAELKTKSIEKDVVEFINQIEDETKRKDALALLKIVRNPNSGRTEQLVLGNITISQNGAHKKGIGWQQAFLLERQTLQSISCLV